MRNHGLPVVLAWLAIIPLCWSGLTEAATYELRVASLPERAFMYFVEGTVLPDMEAFLDTRRSRFVLLRDRQPRALEFLSEGQSESFTARVTYSKRSDPWGATTWAGQVGHVAVFRIRGMQNDYQKLKRVAVEIEGVVTRLVIRSVPACDLRPLRVPATAANYLTRALDEGTFLAWVERRAMSYEGLSVVVGRYHGSQESDTVYLVLRTPAPLRGRTYKVILGWKTTKRDGVYAITQGRRN